MSASPPPDGPLTPQLRRQLEDTRRALLRLHKALLDFERIAYERVRGRIASSGTLLQLVINDPWFAWLRPMSEMIVRIDEMSESEEPVPAAEARAILDRVAVMVRADENGDEFGRRYHAALQESPEVVARHVELKNVGS